MAQRKQVVCPDVPILTITPLGNLKMGFPTFNLERWTIENFRRVGYNTFILPKPRNNNSVVRVPLLMAGHSYEDRFEILRLFVNGFEKVWKEGFSKKRFGFNIACMSILKNFVIAILNHPNPTINMIETYYIIQCGIDQLMIAQDYGYKDHYNYNKAVEDYPITNCNDLRCLMTSVAFDPTIFIDKRSEWTRDIIENVLMKGATVTQSRVAKFTYRKDATDEDIYNDTMCEFLSVVGFDLKFMDFHYLTASVQMKILDLSTSSSRDKLLPLFNEILTICKDMKTTSPRKIIKDYFSSNTDDTFSVNEFLSTFYYKQ